MPRTKRKNPTCRMNLEMSLAVRERLDKLGQEADCSLAEVIRRSLAVYDLLHGEIKKGSTLVIRGPDGEKELVIL